MPRMSGKARWVNEAASHELYNAGHLYEAAAAHYQATGKRTLLDVAIKNADLVAREFGPGKLQNPPGHEVIEIGLGKLYRVTGDVKYLHLAKFLIDIRGRAETHSSTAPTTRTTSRSRSRTRPLAMPSVPAISMPVLPTWPH